MGDSRVRLAAAQVIERPPAEVFRFVATDHFQNHRKWDPAITSITKTSPGPMGVGATARLIRTDRGRQIEGSMEVTEYEPVGSSTVVSRFDPFTLQARTTFAPVAPASTRLQLVMDTHARGGHGLAAAADEGDVPQDDGQEPLHHQGAGGSHSVADDVTRLESQRDLLYAIHGTPSRMLLLLSVRAR
jgi:Polyketide cyclase / dehydrase and lipid transport